MLYEFTSVGNGSWVVSGVTTNRQTTSGNSTNVQCTSTHLTSFAVLVDVAGGLEVYIVNEHHHFCHEITCIIIILYFCMCHVVYCV